MEEEDDDVSIKVWSALILGLMSEQLLLYIEVFHLLRLL